MYVISTIARDDIRRPHISMRHAQAVIGAHPGPEHVDVEGRDAPVPVVKWVGEQEGVEFTLRVDFLRAKRRKIPGSAAGGRCRLRRLREGRTV